MLGGKIFESQKIIVSWLEVFNFGDTYAYGISSNSKASWCFQFFRCTSTLKPCAGQLTATDQTLYFGHLNFFPETKICSCPILKTIQRAFVLLSFNLLPEILLKSRKICIADVREFSEPSKIWVVSSAYWLILTSSLPREKPLMLLLGPFIRGKIRRVLNKTRTFRINGRFRLK